MAWKMKTELGQEKKIATPLGTETTKEIDIGKGIRNRQRLLNSLA